MVKKCEDCGYYSKTNEHAMCHYSEATTNIHDDSIPRSLYTVINKLIKGVKAIPESEGGDGYDFDDPYRNETYDQYSDETYDQWIARLKTYEVSDTFTKTTNIIKEKEPEPTNKKISRFDDII